MGRKRNKMKLTYTTWILILIGFSKEEERKPFETTADKEIKILKEIIDASVFCENYVRVGVPVVMKRVANDIFDEIFNPESIPQLFTTYLEVKNKNDGSSRNMSFHQFQNIHEQGMVYIDSAIPTVIKSRIQVPKILLCKPLIENMIQTRLRIPAGEGRYDVEKSSHDRIIFQFGSSKVHLFNSTQAMAENNVEQFDSEQTTEHFTALLVSGDALFIPVGWSWQQETSNDYISLEFYWNLGSNADSTSFECGDHITKDFLTISFPKDPRIDLLSVIEFEELHHFIKEYYLSQNSMDFHHFMTVLLTDDQFAGLPEWDEESQDIAREMFNQMDYNNDGVLSKEDFNEITKEDLQLVAGRIEDRLADFEDIREDATAERRGSLADAKKKASSNLDDIRKLIQDGFGEILGDIDVATAKESNTDSEIADIKRIENLIKNHKVQNSKDEL